MNTSTSLRLSTVVPRTFAYDGQKAKAAPSIRQVAALRLAKPVQRAIRQAEKDYRTALDNLYHARVKHGIQQVEGGWTMGGQSITTAEIEQIEREERTVCLTIRQEIIGQEKKFFKLANELSRRGCKIPSDLVSCVEDEFEQDVENVFRWYAEQEKPAEA